ncbi:putative GPI-anchored protein [Acorus calamus]|uniref:GPI-anchored protein n=1 Tax=Acorus calamus TaxID=4465 RepID=A0AAV9FIK1_ACOCL|nr:putative GPI-anchored protein [Acorus calamus]
MFQISLTLLTVFSALPVLLVADSALLQPFFPGSAASSSASTTAAATIPAFPEQSDVAGCPLDLPDDLFSHVGRACSSGTAYSPVNRGRCCPTLAAWLYSAHSSAALRHTSSSASSNDFPVLPDDSESCIDAAEKALKARGVHLRPPNGTCDVVYCYCGVRLRPFTCPEAFRVGPDGRWAEDDKVRRIERDCSAGSGVAACSRCLRSLHQLKNESVSDRKGKLRSRECELMGVTWLLAKNRTAYMPTVTSVLRALMVSPDGSDRRSCALARDGLPLAVDSDLLSDPSSSIVGSGFPSTLILGLIGWVIFLILTRV